MRDVFEAYGEIKRQPSQKPLIITFAYVGMVQGKNPSQRPAIVRQCVYKDTFNVMLREELVN